MPDLPTGRWTLDDLDLFWESFRWFVGENQMWIMIIVAFFLSVGVTAIILRLFFPPGEDDDDIDFIRY